MDTTRRFHRSLAAAFPKDHAASIEIHRPVEPLGWRVVRWTLLSVSAFLLAMELAGLLPS
jgi:hypothetical protein